MVERRQQVRDPCNQRAAIRFGRPSHELQCRVLDRSTRGAGLVLDNCVLVPSEFDLQIEGEGRARRCRLVWSDGRRLGVVFE
jgi:hypothetical protein